MENDTLKSAFLVTTVAALFGCMGSNPEPQAPSGSAGSVRCAGINSCKGHGECATADHSCGKHTPCKGQGWLSVSAEDCAAKGGKVL